MKPKVTITTANVMGLTITMISDHDLEQKRSMFKSTRLATGLSIAEAANLLNVSAAKVQRWESGQTMPAKRAFRQIREVERFLIAQADFALSRIRAEAVQVGCLPEAVEVCVASTDEEARSRGFPTVSAARKCASLITAAINDHFPDVKVVTVRRGSTPASAYLVALQEAAGSAA